ncbi:hypothetical protein PAXINDRAFT_84217, partial [Paxillus involutus ATCC 200175]
NVLVGEDQTASLTDFGLSTLLTEVGGQVSSSLMGGGTVRWNAPERLVALTNENVVPEPLKKPTPQSDTYSFGRIMLQVLEGKIPYHYIQYDHNVSPYITKGIDPNRPREPAIDDQDWKYIKSCWNHNPDSRPSDDNIVTFVESRIPPRRFTLPKSLSYTLPCQSDA